MDGRGDTTESWLADDGGTGPDDAVWDAPDDLERHPEDSAADQPDTRAKPSDLVLDASKDVEPPDVLEVHTAPVEGDASDAFEGGAVTPDEGSAEYEDISMPQDGGQGDAAAVQPDISGDTVDIGDIAPPPDVGADVETGGDASDDADTPLASGYPPASPGIKIAYGHSGGSVVYVVDEDGMVWPVLACTTPRGVAAGGPWTIYAACGDGFLWQGAALYKLDVDLSAGVAVAGKDLAPLWVGYGMWVTWRGLRRQGDSVFAGIGNCTGYPAPGELNPAVLEYSLTDGTMTIAAELGCDFSNQGFDVAQDGTIYIGDHDTVKDLYEGGKFVTSYFDNFVWRKPKGGDVVKWLDDFDFEPEGLLMDASVRTTTGDVYLLVSDGLIPDTGRVRVYDPEGVLQNEWPLSSMRHRLAVSASGDAFLLGSLGPILHITPDGEITHIPGTQVGTAGGIAVME